MHQIPHQLEFLAQLSAWMQIRKILRFESLPQRNRDRQRVPQRQHSRRRSGGSQIHPASLALHSHVEHHVTGLCQRRSQIAAE